MRAQIGVQKSTGKIRGNWGRQKGVFLEDLGEWGKGRQILMFWVNAQNFDTRFMEWSLMIINIFWLALCCKAMF